MNITYTLVVWRLNLEGHKFHRKWSLSTNMHFVEESVKRTLKLSVNNSFVDGC